MFSLRQEYNETKLYQEERVSQLEAYSSENFANHQNKLNELEEIKASLLEVERVEKNMKENYVTLKLMKMHVPNIDEQESTNIKMKKNLENILQQLQRIDEELIYRARKMNLE